MCFTETWHDADSAVLGRLRRTGYRPRPRAADDDMSVNHGGVLVMSAADVSLSPIAVTQPTTFELVCAQAAIGSSSVIVVVLYRPSAGWQVILCDPIWHVSSHSGEACFKLLYPVCFTIPVPKAYEHISRSIESQDHQLRLRAVVSKDGLTSNFDRDRFVRSYDTMRARSGAGPFVCLSRGEFAVCYQTVIQLLTT